MNKKVNVVMLSTEKAINENSMLYRPTHDVFGNIVHKVLSYSNNPTYISNTILMNSGKAATNSQSKSELYHLYFTSDEEIKKGTWYYNNKTNRIYKCNGNQLYEGINKKIIATTDKSLLLQESIDKGEGDKCILFKPSIHLISESFIKVYVDADGKIDKIMLEIEQYGIPETPQYRLKIREDNTVIVHPVRERTYTLDEMKLSFQAGARRGYCQRSIMANVGAICKEPDEAAWLEEFNGFPNT